MRYAIFSDIHGNLEALHVMLETCRLNKIDTYICLGDIVGYNANPKECLEIVQTLPGFICCKGNHDEYVSNHDTEMEGFNPHAKAAVLWSRTQLNQDDIDFLAALPMRINVKKTSMTIVHATLDNPEAWGYIFDAHQASDNFAYQYLPLCFCGHSHVPVAFAKRPVTELKFGAPIEEIAEWADRREYSQEELEKPDMITVSLKEGYKYLINIGSVGQPRNRDPRASFVIYDDHSQTLSRMRIPYNIPETQRKILAAGLPERLAQRLERGV